MLKLKYIVMAAACALSASAASPMNKVPSSAPGWGVGLLTGNMQSGLAGLIGTSNGSLQIDYKGANYEHGGTISVVGDSVQDTVTLTVITTTTDVESASNNYWHLGHYMGMRKMIKPQLAASSGISTDTVIPSKWSEFGGLAQLKSIPYDIGFYTQLSYEPVSYVSIFARAKVWSYRQMDIGHTNTQFEDDKINSQRVGFFGNAVVGISYAWQA